LKLTYLDQPAPAGSGAPAVVALHREALVGTSGLHELAELARSAGAGRVVVPVGNYASYPSGMEIGGTCWYRILPGYAGTDPISLATAVVQLGDLLEDLEPSWGSGPPVLVGWGQGAVVGLGAALLWPERVASVVCVDAAPAHVALLPGRCFEPGRRCPSPGGWASC
jgi:pimeloyl-ACP methyl ester carboxylesterase